MAADFSVDPDALRALAGSLGDASAQGQALLAGSRHVPPGAWGRLGDEYGLPDLYTEVRDQADDCLRGIHHFLDATARNLAAVAGEYEEYDADLARRFQRIAGEHPATGPVSR